MKTYTTQEVAEYISGWMIAPDDEPVCDAFIAATNNALAMLEDDQDGIQAFLDRKKELEALTDQ